MSTPIEIVYVHHVDTLGGAALSLVDLLAELDRGEFSPTVLLPGSGELSKMLVAQGVCCIPCQNLGPLRRRGSIVRHAGQVRRLLRGSREVEAQLRARPPSLVHANSTTAALYAAAAARRLNIPLLWHLRDLVPLGWLGRALGCRCARIIAPSKAVEALARECADVRRIVTIPNGIHWERFASKREREDVRARRGIGDGPWLVSVGQLVSWKGYELLVDAMAIVHARRPDARLAVLGSDLHDDAPPHGRRLQDRIRRRGLEGVVQLLGLVEDVSPYLAAADICVHPAFPEPFGRAVVEAMAAGLPVICMGGPHGPAEIVRDRVDGLLVRDRTASGLADAILELVAAPKRRAAMGAAGSVRAKNAFHRRVMAQRCAELYRVALAEACQDDPDARRRRPAHRSAAT